jgi:OmpA-OmpF porin, OOP family
MRVLLPVLAFVVLALLAVWWCVYLILGQRAPQEPAVATTTRLQTLNFTQGSQSILKAYDHFSFPLAQAKPDLNANNALFLDKISSHLQRNPRLLLNITGACSLDEKHENCGFFENLGLARAHEVRKLLIQRGIEARRITLSYNLGGEGIRVQPLAFEAYMLAQSVDFAPLAYTFDDMTFSDESFVPNGTEFRPILPLVQYADSVRKFLSLHKDKKLSIIGHTDNEGEAKTQLSLGRERATNVMRYFRELGIPPRQMAAFSEGSKHPVIDNSSEVGRRRNRRINFILE